MGTDNKTAKEETWYNLQLSHGLGSTTSCTHSETLRPLIPCKETKETINTRKRFDPLMASPLARTRT
eukprot:3405805-Amphidinium_carterae.2